MSTLFGAPRLASPDPLEVEPPERLTPLKERVRWRGLTGSLLLHLLPLLLLIIYLFRESLKSFFGPDTLW